MILSKKASEYLNGAKTCVVGFDAGKVYIFKPTAKLAKAVAANDHVHLNHGKKGGTSFAASAILQDAGTFGTHLYNYKESGNQSFPCEINAKEECLVFTLPVGSLTKRPFTARKKKVVAPATKATPGSTSGEPIPELDLS